jgi:hypothetical protein
MATKEEKKEFALSQLAPYYADPSTCGFSNITDTCEYLTADGRMCVAGKNMLNPENFGGGSIFGIIGKNDNKQEGIFKPEVVGILTDVEWNEMQRIHDNIADYTNTNDKEYVESRIKHRTQILNLFTFEELVERAESLK